LLKLLRRMLKHTKRRLVINLEIKALRNKAAEWQLKG
jgi:hypothetical protein